MNSKQKTIIQTCAVITVLMLIFPPMFHQFQNGATSSAGFNFIFTPPARNMIAMVNLPQLIVQWLLVIGVGAAMFFVQRYAEQKQNPAPPPDLIDEIERAADIAKQKVRRENLLKQIQKGAENKP